MLIYDPTTGLFKHIPPCAHNARQEWHPGSDEHSRGYSVWFGNRNMRAHRVAWYLYYGVWPDNTIDHINGNPKDNRIANLRDVSQKVNNRHILVARAHNHTECLGVTRFRNKFRARITVDGKSIHLGLFKTAEDAKAAYAEAKLKFH